MKKILSLILTFLLCFTFVSCKKETVENLTETTVSDTEETTSFALVSEKTTEETALTSAVTTTKMMITTILETSEKPATTERKTETTASTTAVTATKAAVSATLSDILTTKKRTTTTTTTTNTAITTTTEGNADVVPVVTTQKIKTCTVSVDCSVILDNTDRLKEEKSAFVPSDGKILSSITVEIKQGDTAFEVLKKVCKENVCEENCTFCQSMGIQMESEYTPAYDSYYVEGIHQLYEKDCGSRSGWMYRVNGEFPNVGSSSYKLKDGDVVEWVYTCDLGGEFMN